MRKFRFKLEAVERVKKSREQDALRSLAEAQRALQAEKERKNSLTSRLQESLDRRAGFGSVAMPTTVVRTEEDFIVGTKQRIAQADQAIARAGRAVEKAMAYYLSCRQQRMMMDKLREKALERFQEEVRKRENKESDDLNIMWARIEKGAA